ncbi:L,D-transpeptidase family protein [Actinoplanes sp. NPDC051411]|uniref:L,D-transpeptidase family protein n=1 Tax=Actinoplanes sp. NPDC051411 TaxID=3155522 RepID=UPI003429B4DD
MRRLGVLVGLLAALLTGAPADASVPPWFPTRLTHVGTAQQLLVVVGTGGTYATLHAYQREKPGWREVVPPMAARIGYGGWVWAAARVQETGTTPAGTFTLTDAFGLAADPGAKLPYRRVGKNDYWVGDRRDPRTYNLWEPAAVSGRTWRTGQSERLSSYPVQYQFAVVIDFNRPAPATVSWDKTHREYVTSRPSGIGRGSAIFLHVNGRGSTAGCVSVSRAHLVGILHWLDPAKRPRIAMAPLADIRRA